MTNESTNSAWTSTEAYCNHVEHYLSLGYEPCAPSTVEELHAALERFPDYARRWLPSEVDCIRLGIDRNIGLPVAPLTEHEQDRILMTFRDDDEFRVAVLNLLTGGPAA